MKYISIIILTFLFYSCADTPYTPKPYGYFRIDLPEKEYETYSEECPFSFDIPTYCTLKNDEGDNAEKCWKNLLFQNMKATIHLSYKEVDNNLEKYLEDSRTLVYKHTVKAEAINENLFVNEGTRVFGMMYEIEGNAASPAQFFVTDSTNHFLRGSLYFNVPPNKDSLAPVIEFIKKDIIKIIETITWK